MNTYNNRRIEDYLDPLPPIEPRQKTKPPFADNFNKIKKQSQIHMKSQSQSQNFKKNELKMKKDRCINYHKTHTNSFLNQQQNQKQLNKPSNKSANKKKISRKNPYTELKAQENKREQQLLHKQEQYISIIDILSMQLEKSQKTLLNLERERNEILQAILKEQQQDLQSSSLILLNNSNPKRYV